MQSALDPWSLYSLLFTVLQDAYSVCFDVAGANLQTRNDFLAVPAPRIVPWGSTDLEWLLFVFDWDTISVLNSDISMLTFGLSLCTGVFPCFARLVGEPGGSIELSGSGSLSCKKSSGCLGLSVYGMSLHCHDRASAEPVFLVQGTVLQVTNVTFSNCSSDTDGGVIQAFDLAEVVIQSSRFENVHSQGFGGAIAAFGSNLSISASQFSNCSSKSGGGCVWSAAFQGCYGSSLALSTNLEIHNTLFDRCSTEGSGGAVLADSDNSLLGGDFLSVRIDFSRFLQCSAGLDGGALRAYGERVAVRVAFCRIYNCSAAASGGGLSAGNLSSLSLAACVVDNNTALGLGGGGVHLSSSYFLSYEMSTSGNKAPYGGGGAVFWQGILQPALHGCLSGMKSVSKACSQPESDAQCVFGTCEFCEAGSFQAYEDSSECEQCPAGTFSTAVGAVSSVACSSCHAGTYSSALGSDNFSGCTQCGPGLFSYPAASSCFWCNSDRNIFDNGANSSLVSGPCTSCSASNLSVSNCSDSLSQKDSGTRHIHSDTSGLQQSSNTVEHVVQDSSEAKAVHSIVRKIVQFQVKCFPLNDSNFTTDSSTERHTHVTARHETQSGQATVPSLMPTPLFRLLTHCHSYKAEEITVQYNCFDVESDERRFLASPTLDEHQIRIAVRGMVLSDAGVIDQFFASLKQRAGSHSVSSNLKIPTNTDTILAIATEFRSNPHAALLLPSGDVQVHDPVLIARSLSVKPTAVSLQNEIDFEINSDALVPGIISSKSTASSSKASVDRIQIVEAFIKTHNHDFQESVSQLEVVNINYTVTKCFVGGFAIQY